MLKVISVVGARPNFMKIAPIDRAFNAFKETAQHKICHTGQHFDENMSKIFFEQLKMPKPDFYLGVGSDTHARQTSRIMVEFENILREENPDIVLVPGDVNSTLACTLVASKMNIKVGHVEAGLRSNDRRMPEEINRIVADLLSDLLFVSEQSGVSNLYREGVAENRIHFVGNTMIDSLIHFLPQAIKSNILNTIGLQSSAYILCTFHRPSNVDNRDSMEKMVTLINNLSLSNEVVYPVHPRTRKNLEIYGLKDNFNSRVILLEPLGYLDFLALTKNAKLIITDSGGIQEETTFLGIPCITVRENTERPSTVEVGTNQLVGTDFKRAEIIASEILAGRTKKGQIPNYWDGKTSDRIVKIIIDHFLKG